MKKIDLKPKKPFELPDDCPYKLPKAVNWNQEIYDTITKYGLFQHKNKVYIIRAGAKKETPEGTKTEYIFTAVSNFSIAILQHMEDEKYPMKLVKIRNIDGRERTFETASDNFTSIGSFKKMVEGWGNFNFEKGTATDYSKVKTFLMDQMGDGRMINVLGWQHEGFWAFNNMAIDKDGKLYRYNEYGSFSFDEVQYYVPSANKIYRMNQNKFVNQKLVDYIDTGVTFAEWSAQMCKVHRQHAHIAIAFGVACIFSDIIFNHHKFFPMYFLYGEASTGKSKLIEAIQRLFGYPQSPIQITGKANTDKAKIRKFAQFNNMVVFLEEFNNTADVEMLKGLWNRYGYERGNIDSAFGTDSVPISSGVTMTGNEYPINDALLTRLIIDEMLRNTFTDSEKLEFGKLEKMMQDGYSSIIQEIIKHRAYFEEEYKKNFSHVKKEVTLMLSGIQGVVDRMIENASVLITVHEVLNTKINFGFSKGQLKDTLAAAIERQNNKRDSGGEVAKWWEVFLLLFRSGEIIINKDFKLDGNKLYLFFNVIQPLYYKKHFEVFRMPGVAKSTLTDKLKKHVSFIEVKASHRIGPNKTSAYVFDIGKIGEDVKNNIISIGMERNEISTQAYPDFYGEDLSEEVKESEKIKNNGKEELPF